MVIGVSVLIRDTLGIKSNNWFVKHRDLVFMTLEAQFIYEIWKLNHMFIYNCYKIKLFK